MHVPATLTLDVDRSCALALALERGAMDRAEYRAGMAEVLGGLPARYLLALHLADLFYTFEHEELATLILTQGVTLDWRSPGRTLSRPISRLIDKWLRSLEPLLSRLALDRLTEVTWSHNQMLCFDLM